MREGSEIIADHYQKTYELTLQVWEQRNTTFLLLLIVVGIATLLTFNVPQAQPLLVDIIAKLVGITDTSDRFKELRQSFPYGIIQSILLMIILYLMVILYHRTAFISRCYQYLGAIEPEIKESLGLPLESVVFTRESQFYWKYRSPYARLVAMTYIGMLGLLLLAFLGFRIYSDFALGNIIIGLIDIIIGLPTLLFFTAYIRTS